MNLIFQVKSMFNHRFRFKDEKIFFFTKNYTKL